MNKLSRTLLVIFACILSGCGGKSKLHMAKSLFPEANLVVVDSVEDSVFPESISISESLQKQYNGSNNIGSPVSRIGSGLLRKKWSSILSHRTLAEPIVASNKVFVLNKSGISCLDAKNGKRIWRNRIASASGDIAIIDDRLICLASGALHEISANNGEILSQIKINDDARVMSIFGNLAYITNGYWTGAFDISKKQMIWERKGIEKSGHIEQYTARPAVSDKHIVIPYQTGTVLACTREEGKLLWNKSLISNDIAQSSAEIQAGPVLWEGLAIISNVKNKTVAFRVNDGKEMWSIPAGSLHSATVVKNWGYIMSSDNILICFNPKNGDIAWKTSIPTRKFHKIDHQYCNRPVIWGGEIIISTQDMKMLAINPKNGAITNSWSIEKRITTPMVPTEMCMYSVSGDNITAWK